MMTTFKVEELPAGSSSTALDYDAKNVAHLIEDKNNTTLILQLLEQRQLFVRLGAVQLLIIINRHQSRELQDSILFNPTAIMQLMDMLGDKEEMIRNEVLLLITGLASSNAEIQKIASINGAFERLFDIMKEEGNCGVIVNDCFQLMQNLLHENSVTQRFFREMSSIDRLGEFLGEECTESKSKLKTAKLVLGIVEELGIGIPGDTQNNAHVAANQEQLGRHVLMGVAQIALGGSTPSDMRCLAFQALGTVVEGHEANSGRLWRIVLPDGTPAISKLLACLFMENADKGEMIQRGMGSREWQVQEQEQ